MSLTPTDETGNADHVAETTRAEAVVSSCCKGICRLEERNAIRMFARKSLATSTETMMVDLLNALPCHATRCYAMPCHALRRLNRLMVQQWPNELSVSACTQARSGKNEPRLCLYRLPSIWSCISPPDMPLQLLSALEPDDGRAA